MEQRGGTLGTWLLLSMAGCCRHGGNEVPSIPSSEMNYPRCPFIIHHLQGQATCETSTSMEAPAEKFLDGHKI